MLRILRSSDYPTRPWKNGGGTTRDIVVSPPGASLDDFDWRLSLAQVDRDGPFSRFDNVDRTLVLLSGAMTLHEQESHVPRDFSGQRSLRLRSPLVIHLVRGEPVTFEGERAIEATLAGGSTLDLNVMTRRDRARHTVRRENFGERADVASTRGSTIVLFALESGLTVDGELLDVHDTAVITAQRSVVSASAGTATALIVEIRPNVL